jgi:hypothetical protein
MTSNHLGGHFNVTHIDLGALNFFTNELKIKSFLDIGRGPMGMVNLAKQLGLDAVGIDGDPKLNFKNNFISHDFTSGKLELVKKFDLAWSVEFLEHVEERYIENIISAFKACKYAFITHALPNKKGFHHVNCQKEEYWIQVFENFNFKFDAELTSKIKKSSTMKREFVKQTGKMFINKID